MERLIEQLGAWSRSQRALTRFSIAIVLIAIGVGFAVAAPPRTSPAEILKDAVPKGQYEAYHAYRDAIKRGDWLVAIEHVPKYWLEQLINAGPWIIALALWSGLTWWLFLFRASEPIRPMRRNKRRLVLFGTAILLGMISTQLTLFLSLVFDLRFGFTYDEASDSWARGVMYCIFSIGLREEFSKLICFLPLLPFLLKRNHAMEALITASCVGLGFAIEENFGYFASTRGAAAVPRFLTASFAHLVLTGIVGHALWWGCKYPRQQAQRAVGMFALAVVVHGVYDALLIVPLFNEYSLFAVTVFVLISYQYFHELRGQWTRQTYPISLTGVFVFGLVTTACLAYLLLCSQLGVKVAANSMIDSLLGVAVITIMYFREVDEVLLP